MSEEKKHPRSDSGACAYGGKSPRICEYCGLDLHEVATMRGINARPAITVRRCETCKKVTASEG